MKLSCVEHLWLAHCESTSDLLHCSHYQRHSCDTKIRHGVWTGCCRRFTHSRHVMHVDESLSQVVTAKKAGLSADIESWMKSLKFDSLPWVCHVLKLPPMSSHVYSHHETAIELKCNFLADYRSSLGCTMMLWFLKVVWGFERRKREKNGEQTGSFSSIKFKRNSAGKSDCVPSNKFTRPLASCTRVRQSVGDFFCASSMMTIWSILKR